MTVSELIEHLHKFPGEYRVVLSGDSEGNKFSPLEESFTRGVYVPESTWSGDFFGEDELEDGDGLGKSNAIVLWPIN